MASYYVLFYDYVDDYLERRDEFRAAHFAWAREAQERGELIMAGAFAEPADGAALVFKTGDAASVERFVADDPYVLNGLVTGWRVRPWTVVLGGDDGAGR